MQTADIRNFYVINFLAVPGSRKTLALFDNFYIRRLKQLCMPRQTNAFPTGILNFFLQPKIYKCTLHN